MRRSVVGPGHVGVAGDTLAVGDHALAASDARARGPDGEEVPYTNSASGAEGEGWFAVQDVTVVEGGGPPLFAN